MTLWKSTEAMSLLFLSLSSFLRCGFAIALYDVPVISLYEFNFLTALIKFKNTTENEAEFMCGGILIHPLWTLTAWNCFVDDLNIKNYLIYAGAEYIQISGEGQRRMIYEIHTPTDCKVRDECSIALIMVDHPFRMTDTVQPATLPRRPLNENTECIALRCILRKIRNTDDDVDKIVAIAARSYSANYQSCFDELRALNKPLISHLHKENYCVSVTEPIGNNKAIRNKSIGFPSICNGRIQGIVSYIANDDEPTIVVDLSYHLAWTRKILLGRVQVANEEWGYSSSYGFSCVKIHTTGDGILSLLCTLVFRRQC
ncbi:thrombin-like enzyme gyroxin B1.4 [Photinus pyralis]|uniref:thrombin-like enzyme gyroxin B1.4 n=1 Tax=Photinus pyralis TaxID=7054 RepID=UPI001266E7C8|nr:thrombin-like enzyme gyroxin B1.4 [Photinus pyralis]